MSEGAKNRIAEIAARFEARGFPGKFERTDKYHITLAFLGWVEPSRVDEIEEVTQKTAAQHRSFSLRLDRVGAFPHERKPRIVWLGSRAQPETFRKLSADLRGGYEKLGFIFKDAAVAHVTLCRIKEEHAPMPTISEFDPIEIHVTELTLFESVPAGPTTRYIPRSVAQLSSLGASGV